MKTDFMSMLKFLIPVTGSRTDRWVDWYTELCRRGSWMDRKQARKRETANLHAWTESRIDGWMDGWMDELMSRWIIE
jgi:hypothetical protein